MTHDPPLAGQVALVTGSGRGLGRAMATRLAHLRASVAIHDGGQEAPAELGEAKSCDEVAAQLATATGSKTFAACANIASEEEVAAMVHMIESTLGPISILVHNAGGDIALRGGKPKPNNALDRKAH